MLYFTCVVMGFYVVQQIVENHIRKKNRVTIIKICRIDIFFLTGLPDIGLYICGTIPYHISVSIYTCYFSLSML